MLLEVAHISLSINGSPILRDISFSVQAGEVVSLIGPNGSGKSTLMKCIMNLHDGVVVNGDIFFQGQSILGEKTSRIVKKGVSYIPQGNTVFPSLTVEDNLRLALIYANRQSHAMFSIFEQFPQLAEKRKEKASRLSGGERQLLGLGRALVTEPTLLLLDEPTAGLSPKLAAQFFSWISSLKNKNTSIILVEQKVKEAVEIADQVCILKAGEVFFLGPREAATLNENLQKAYLGG